MSVTISAGQASALPSALRNSIYSTLLSTGGIRNIESALIQLLQTSGFQHHLRAYITELFRTGQATTANEAYQLAMARIRECWADGERETAGNGIFGEVVEAQDLRLPSELVREGSRVVKRELERVVIIETD
jgi:hypothetical protein